MNKNSRFQNIHFILKLGSWGLALSLFGSILSTAANFSLLFLVGKISEISLEQVTVQIFNPQPFINIGLLVLIMLPTIILFQSLNLIGGQNAEKNLSKAMMSHAIHLKEKVKLHSATLMNILTVDVSSLSNFYFQGVHNDVIMPFLMGLFALIVCFSMSWQFGIIATIIGLLNLIVSSRFATPIQKGYEAITHQNENTTNELSEILSNEEFVRNNSLQAQMLDQFDTQLKHLESISITTDNHNTTVRTIGQAFNFFTSFLFLLLGLILSQSGSIAFSKVVLLLPLQGSIGRMFMTLPLSYNYLSDVIASAKRIRHSLHQEGEDETISTTKTPRSESEDALIIENLSFGYSPKETILKDISITLKQKKMLALVGASGSGKSTLLKLLLSIYDVEDGHFILNGYDTQTSSLTDLRSQIAYVQQEAPLFNMSIKDNIALAYNGPLEHLDEAMISATTKAHIHDFIASLPNGYDTIVEESGKTLSGGQRQRIALARAFISSAPILLMDEPTSALDHSSELAISAAIETIRQEKTIIMTAHKLDTIKDADQIIVLEQGEIVEVGNHNELLQNDATYAKLVNQH